MWKGEGERQTDTQTHRQTEGRLLGFTNLRHTKSEKKRKSKLRHE